MQETLKSDLNESLFYLLNFFEPLKNKTVTITGLGFMGSWLVRALTWLNDNHEFKIKIYVITKHIEKANIIVEAGSRKEDTVVIEEAEMEIEAQYLRFKEITGKDPDYFECHAVISQNFFIALRNVAKKYGLFYENVVFDQEFEKENIKNLILTLTNIHDSLNEGEYFDIQNELTDSIKEHINSSIEVFKKYNLDIISVNAIISQEEKHGKKAFSFEFTLNIANLDTVVVKQKDKDLYSAVDIAVDRVSKVLRRHHDKIAAHKATKLTEVVATEIQDQIALELEKFEDEITPVRLTSYKPMDIEEALDELKESDAQFKVFYDKDDVMRVLYKSSIQGKFGKKKKKLLL